MLLLGIETSCDETSAAVARGPTDRGVEVLSNVVASQDDLHAHFGGIVPEVASRRHIEMILPVIREAMQRASVTWEDLEGIAVTNGPGLIGSLVVGVSTAKGLAQARSLPLVGVHHLEAHIYSAAIGRPLPFPLLALIASGGHSHLVLVRDHGHYQVLGRTRDDAPGEAFDKGARLLGLPYPGGPQLAALADSFSGRVTALPRAQLPNSRDFSFSGVKTALARTVRAGQPDEPERARLAAAYQESIALSLADRTLQVADEIGECPIFAVGGVARNARLRQLLAERADKTGLRVHFPDPDLCTDNGAMVAAAGIHKLARVGADPTDLDCFDNLPLQSWAKNSRR
ncbi:MAG: tRNA (adenosine(37)-N6)-threonylcarbamoyltransferase complex transferase subunit TsaD [Armatimonadota bacterium]|nr:MAG: tRNA (adenosine(37)-N6)-threonylcarbamoyltransferase complex transferase subunit TsaD [Armatimonadota bacterium]